MNRTAIFLVVGVCAVAIPPLVVMGQTPLGPVAAAAPVFSSQYSVSPSIPPGLIPPLDSGPSSLDKAEKKLDEAFDLLSDIAGDRADKVLTRHGNSSL